MLFYFQRQSIHFLLWELTGKSLFPVNRNDRFRLLFENPHKINHIELFSSYLKKQALQGALGGVGAQP
ncbi:hypothetical protein ABGC20_RS26375, partial [Escherichia coli]|jgi:hypothetical protein|uniref:hypothetical protein n=1 Tax=Escherichia coli TaxID=562 RepID=UPI001BAF6FB2